MSALETELYLLVSIEPPAALCSQIQRSSWQPGKRSETGAPTETDFVIFIPCHRPRMPPGQVQRRLLAAGHRGCSLTEERPLSKSTTHPHQLTWPFEVFGVSGLSRAGETNSSRILDSRLTHRREMERNHTTKQRSKDRRLQIAIPPFSKPLDVEGIRLLRDSIIQSLLTCRCGRAPPSLGVCDKSCGQENDNRYQVNENNQNSNDHHRTAGLQP